METLGLTVMLVLPQRRKLMQDTEADMWRESVLRVGKDSLVTFKHLVLANQDQNTPIFLW